MTKSIIGCYNQSASSFSGASATYYLPLKQGGLVRRTGENEMKVPVNYNGTLSDLSCHIPSNSRATTSTLRSRINGSNGTQVISITAGATGFFRDITNSDIISAGDVINASFTNGTGSQTLSIVSVSAAFLADSGHVWIGGWHQSGIDPTFSSNSNTTYMPLLGGSATIGFDTADIRNRELVRAEATMTSLQAYVLANTRTTTCTIRPYINGSAANITLSIPGATTGTFQDLVNSDNYNSGDEVNAALSTLAGGGDITVSGISCNMLSDGNEQELIAHATAAASRISATGDFFMPIFGTPAVNIATESTAQIEVPFECNWKNMRIRVGSVSGATLTMASRINGFDGNQVISIPSGSTGIYEDSVNSDDLLDGDKICYKLTSAASSLLSVERWYASTLSSPTPPSPGGKRRVVIVMQ